MIVVSRNGLRGDNYNSPLFYDLDKKYKDQWKINKRKGIKKDVKKKEIGELCSPLNINGNDDE